MVTLHGIEVKVGDKVFDTRFGWSKIIKLCDGTIYEIVTDISCYTPDGKYNINDKVPFLFWNEFEIPKCAFIKPLPNLKVDTKVLVWNDNCIKERRYFSHFDKYGNICCFNSGATGWGTKNATTTVWNNWELFEEE
jgi:hypothetical protein